MGASTREYKPERTRQSRPPVSNPGPFADSLLTDTTSMVTLYKLAVCSLRFAYFRTQGLTPSVQEISIPAFGTMSVPSTHRALTVVERGDQATNKPGRVEVQERPVPALREDSVLVRVKSVALNPTDWKVIISHILVRLQKGTDALP